LVLPRTGLPGTADRSPANGSLLGVRSYIVTQFRHAYEIGNIDRALDASFAGGESPRRLDLGAEKWP
jgi:hypothetical protein